MSRREFFNWIGRTVVVAPFAPGIMASFSVPRIDFTRHSASYRKSLGTSPEYEAAMNAIIMSNPDMSYETQQAWKKTGHWNFPDERTLASK